MKSIPRNLINDGIYQVAYVEYKDDGNEKYSFIAVRSEEVTDFENSLKSDSFDPEQFGIVLESGKGQAPKIIKEKMFLLYKCKC